MDRRAPGSRNPLQELRDGGLVAVGQDPQNRNPSGRHTRRDDHHEIAMPLFQGDLIQTEHGQLRRLRPIDLRRNAPLNDAQHDSIGQPLLDTDLLDRGIHHLQQQVGVIRRRLRAVGFVPTHLLGCGRLTLAGVTPITLGPIPQIHRPPQNRQMTDGDPRVVAVQLAKLTTTAPTARTRQPALHGDDELTLLGDLRLQDLDIGNIQRDRNPGG